MSNREQLEIHDNRRLLPPYHRRVYIPRKQQENMQQNMKYRFAKRAEDPLNCEPKIKFKSQRQSVQFASTIICKQNDDANYNSVLRHMVEYRLTTIVQDQ